MANFMIRFLLCNVFISGIVGILLIAKQRCTRGTNKIKKQLVQPDAV